MASRHTAVADDNVLELVGKALLLDGARHGRRVPPALRAVWWPDGMMRCVARAKPAFQLFTWQRKMEKEKEKEKKKEKKTEKKKEKEKKEKLG